ncbi:hypothetical protein EZL74_05640 [Flavobacterium silvisoli]|uniref:Uncharacterized protein n=1 Tax=Flavobacterium silvisoli TaxID=2529433 RepID=A0A4Q9Z0S5_9FLAO|nr:hypothetical protein [Flavobacterium silvisoli]TBX69898.1 hypothetical protein EZL74_05640 [Flavobacterium silvisoli]
MKSLSNIIILFFALTLQAQTEKEMYLFSDDIAAKIEKDTVSWKYQIGATDYSISGYHNQALTTWDKNGSRKPKITKEDSLYFKNFTAHNAKEYIIKRSKKEQIIIINEAHHNAGHRVFTTSLLNDLYQNGYRFLGLEAINDTSINNRKFATKDSGYYTNEPQLANMIHQAIQIGFTIFNYEASEEKNGKEREIEQAENIAEIIEKNPRSKFLIHCGYDHVIEGIPGNKSWEKAMAGRLKDLVNIDPFTIDQVSYTEHGNAEFNSPYIQMLNKDFPCILADKNNNLFTGNPTNKQTDCRIIHSKTKYKKGRPTWLTLNGQRKYFNIPKSKIKQFPALVLAYRMGEYEQNGIPVDILEIQNNQQNTTLILEKGRYNIIVKNKDYQVIEHFEQIIK